MRSWVRIVAVASALIMVTLAFQSVGAQAHLPNTGANEYNHAAGSNGATATASGSSGSNLPGNAIDGSTSTYWQSSTTTGWLAVRFGGAATIDEVHLHFTTTKYAALSLYADRDGDATYETKVWSTTKNGALDVVAGLAPTSTFGIKVTIDAKVGSNKPMINELEAYLRYDSDGDGLLNAFEAGTAYYYNATSALVPVPIPDHGSNNTTLSTNRLGGVPFRGLADFTVDYAGAKEDLSATLSYWNGTDWVNAAFWDPGKKLTRPVITYPAANARLNGDVRVTATVEQPSLTKTLSFYLDGVLKASPPPAGNTYSWTWSTAGYAEGSHTLMASVVDVWDGTSQQQISVYKDTTAPTVSIQTSGIIVCSGESVTLTGSASDAGGLDSVNFVGTWYDKNGETTWSGSANSGPLYPIGHFTPRTYHFGISATDLVGLSGSATVDVVADYCPEAPGSTPIIEGASSPAGSLQPLTWPGEGTFLSPSTVMLSAGVGKTSAEAGYGLAGSRHRVVVNLTRTLSAMSSAERSARILPAGLPGDLLNTVPTWRLSVRDWTTGTAGSIVAFTLRTEETTSLTSADTDGDGLTDAQEIQVRGTSPIARDTDADGLADAYEVTPHPLTVWVNGTSSILSGLTTNPLAWDTDADGLADGQERGAVSTGQTRVIGEVGRIQNLTTAWRTVYLKNRYTAAVVIAEPPTLRGNLFGHVQLRNVGDHTFEARIQNWTTATGNRAREDVTYLVLEAGNYFLPDGTSVEAGTKAGITVAPSTVTFRESFVQVPLVLVQAQTTANTAPLVAKTSGAVGADLFFAYLNANGSSLSTTETLGYIAVSAPATGAGGSWSRAEVTGCLDPTPCGLPGSFSTAPLVLGWYAGEGSGAGKTIGLRLKSVTNTSVTLYRERTDTASRTETIDFFVFAGPMNLTARMTTRPNGTGSADTDGDGLSDGAEVLTYGSDPTRTDTDSDGIADKVEVTSRSMTIPVNGAMTTVTFTTSPTSDDTDADGVKDPDEVNGILDHKVLFYDMQTTADAAHLRDLSGNGNLGTLAGTSSSVSGKVGNARDFDGGNSYVEAGDLADFEGTTPFAVSAWFRRDADHNYWPRILSKESLPDANGNRQGWLLYINKVDAGDGSTLDNKIGFDRWSGNDWSPAHFSGVTSTTVTATNTWYHVAVTYDGATLRMYVNGVLESSSSATNALVGHPKPLRVGALSDGGWSGFNGAIDEVQVWDRTLSPSEISAYNNVTNAGLPLVWLDLETRNGNDLFDFSGAGHAGVVTGTTVIEGRSGFARRFAGGSDGIDLSGTAVSGLLASAVTVDVQVLLSSLPASDVALAARKGQFFLNMSSDGRARWTLSGGGTTMSAIALPLNRWVRLTGTAYKTGTSTSRLSLYVDGGLVASGTGGAFPTSSSKITLGYTEGLPHLVGATDEVRILATEASSWTVRDLGLRGIQLNPNATDTDGDGLADGQELLVRTVSTSKRVPTRDREWAQTEWLDLGLAVPAWAIQGVQAMVGFTHDRMGDVLANLVRTTGGTGDGATRLRDLSGSTEVNNFTAYDLLQKPAFAGYTWFTPYDFLKPSRSWYLDVYDGKPQGMWIEGHIEYLTLTITMHTLPNNADTDRDGLDDTEEINLGLDGFATDPWKADTDGDGLADNEYFVKGTDPTRADTDRDGFNDNVDRVPLADVFVRVYIDTLVPRGPDYNDGGSLLEAFASASIGSDASYSSSYSVSSGGTVPFHHSFSVNVDDSAATVPITLRAWDYDTRTDAGGHAYDVHNAINLTTDTSYGGCSGVAAWSFAYTIGQPGDSLPLTHSGYCPGGNPLYADPIHILVLTEAPVRNGVFLVAPLDYSGVYNLTDARGNVVSRRYTGEPRFVAILANVTDTTYGGASNEKVLYLLPRSLFPDTKLYAVLNDPSRSPTDPVVFDATMTFEGTTGASSDALQSMLVVNVTVAQNNDGLARLESYLASNASGGTIHRVLLITDTALVMNLPDDVMRVLSYAPPTNTPTSTYRFCTTPNCGAGLTTPSIWDQLWAGVVAVVSVCLQYVASAIVATVNFFVLVGNVLAQFGAWLWNAVQTAAAAVASAVQAAATVVGQVVDWAIGAVRAIVQGLLDPLISLIRMAVEDFRNRIAEALQTAFVRHSPSEADIDPAASAERLYVAVSASALFMLVGLVVSLLEIAEILTKPVSIFIAAAVAVIGGVIAGYLVSTLTSAAPTTGDQDITNGPEDALGTRIVDVVPDSAWQDARTKWTLAAILTTFTLRFLMTTLLETNLARSAEFALASFFLWDFGFAIPALGSTYGLVVALVGLGLSAVSLVLALKSGLERVGAPITWTVISAVSLTSVILGLANLDRAIKRTQGVG